MIPFAITHAIDLKLISSSHSSVSFSRALHYVCSLGSSEFTLKGLLKQGACLEIRNEASMSPLMIAVKANNLKTAAILVQAGADMMAENEKGISTF